MNQRLIEIRKDSNLTQSEFAEKLNLNRPTISNYESGRRVIPDRTISDICRIFNVNEIWLRTGTGPMYRPPLTTNDSLAAKIGELISSDDEFVKNFILEYLKLSDDSKKEVKNFIKSISQYIK